MTDRALVTLRAAVRDGAVRTRERALIDAHAPAGIHVEPVPLPHATLVTGPRDALEALASRELRVKRIRDAHLLRIHGHAIDVEQPAGPPVGDGLDVPAELADRWHHHLVQLIGPSHAPWIRALERGRPLRVVETVSSCGLFVHGPPAAVDALRALPFVIWTAPFAPRYRIAPGLEARAAAAGDRPIRVRAGVYPARQEGSVRERIARAGGTVRASWARRWDRFASWRVLVAEFPGGRGREGVTALATHPDVRFVEYKAARHRVEDEVSAQIVSGGLGGVPPQPHPGYRDALATLAVDGSGVVIGVCDTGIDGGDVTTVHDDFAGRLRAVVDRDGEADARDRDGHGTHVAGVALGGGASETRDHRGFEVGLGVAPGAELVAVNSVTEGVFGIHELVADVLEHGADVMNNSWNDPGGVGYSEEARAVDAAVRDPDPTAPVARRLAIVFSAGNAGDRDDSVTHPKEAKNAIVVGASLNARPGEQFDDDDVDGIAGFSSRGYAGDGRLLPTVVAPGTDVVSARSRHIHDAWRAVLRGYRDRDGQEHPDHLMVTGTSVAAPHVAGLLALYTEAWRRWHAGDTPSAALHRALLVAGADDLRGGSNWRLLPDWDGEQGYVFHYDHLPLRPSELQMLAWTPGNPGRWEQRPQPRQDSAAAFDAAVEAGVDGAWWYDRESHRLRAYYRQRDPLVPRFLSPHDGGSAFRTCGVVWARDERPLGPIPNRHQGWGRASSTNVLLQHPDAPRGPTCALDQTVAFTREGEQLQLRVAPVVPGLPMRIVLTWTDAPGSPGEVPNLKNDINLEVLEERSGALFLGNQFEEGFSVPGGSADALDNTECVFLREPRGPYTLTVLASRLADNARLPGDPADPWQDFALVVDNGEWRAGPPVAMAVVVERSAAVAAAGLEDALRAAATELTCGRALGDGLGLLWFAEDVEVAIGGDAPAEVDGTPARDAATAAVDATTFAGEADPWPAMQRAGAMLAAAEPTASPCAVVLATSAGPRASAGRLPPTGDGVRLFTCALGPGADTAGLAALAANGGGRFAAAACADEVLPAVQALAAAADGRSLLALRTVAVPRAGEGPPWDDDGAARIEARVDRSCTQLDVTIGWLDPHVRVVSRRPSGPFELEVRLLAPDGQPLASRAASQWIRDDPRRLGLRIDAPRAGCWTVLLRAGMAGAVRCSVACSAHADVRLRLTLPTSAALGEPLPIRARIEAAGAAPTADRVLADVTRPADGDRPRQTDRILLAPTAEPGCFVGEYLHADAGGVYDVTVTARGVCETTGTRFTRVDRHGVAVGPAAGDGVIR